MASAALVEIIKVTKVFPGVVANDQVDLCIYPGEIHALLGENGAGKSTLMSILTGLYRPDGGELFVKGNKANFVSPRHAIKAGIGMVHQHFRLVQPFTVAENIALGASERGFRLNLGKIESKLLAFSEQYGLQVDPKAKIWQLSVGEQQRVEIVKLLYHGADILILDEPTAVLTPQEANELYGILRKMADQGKGVIVITHKLQEVMEHADRITVLRGGKSIATVMQAETHEQELTGMMVGRDIELNFVKESVKQGEVVLKMQQVNALGDKGTPALRQVSLDIRAGEILGIAGVAGNGQRELAEVITGLRRVESGQILIGGQDLTNKSPLEVIESGVSHIPEDRCGTGLVPTLGATENVILKSYRENKHRKGVLINWDEVKRFTQEMVERFDIKLASLGTPVKMMSGGNMQKLLLAREISADPRLIIAMYPVRGLDIAAIEAVRNLLLEARKAGKAVLLISEELDELFSLSDRIAVLHHGEVMGIVKPETATVAEVGMMMAGKQVAVNA